MKIGVFDLEANGLLQSADTLHCATVKTLGTDEVHSFYECDFTNELIPILDTFDVLIAHNGIGYDFPLLRKLFKWEFKGKKVDTLIMSRLLDPKRIVPFNCPNKKAGPHSLECWGYRVGRGKPEHNDWEVFSMDMLHRNKEDVEITELTYNALMEEAKGGGWGNAFKLSFELFERLQQQEEYGWLVDQEHMKFCIRQLSTWIDRIDRVITPQLPLILEVEETKEKGQYKYVKKPFLKSGKYSESVSRWFASNNLDPSVVTVAGSFTRVSFRVTNLDSNAETKDFLLSMGWEPLEWNTNDDGERTSPKLSKEDPFEGVEGKLGKLVAKRVQCRQRRGIIEGLLSLVREDGRIGSVVNTLAVTGRATHRNIVNIPKASSFYGKQMRQIFTSGEGMVLVGTDSAGNQLRQLAARMNNPEYIHAMVSGNKDEGTDPHTLTQKAGDLESRDIAKNVIYCLLFGGGDAKLAKTAKKPAGTGADLRDKLYRGLDGLGSLMERLSKQWKETARQRFNPKFNRMEYFDGKIKGLDGRPIKVPSEHQLLVYLLQSDEAIHMARAYVILCKRLSEKFVYGVDYGVVCWYHDEYTIECRKEIAEEVKLISEQSIAEAGKYYNIVCPHAGEGAIGRNWYDIH